MKVTRELFKIKTNLDYLSQMINETSESNSKNDSEILKIMNITKVMFNNFLTQQSVNNIQYEKSVTRLKLTDFQTIPLNTPFLLNEYDPSVYVKKLIGKNYYISNIKTGISTLASKKMHLCAVLQILNIE